MSAFPGQKKTVNSLIYHIPWLAKLTYQTQFTYRYSVGVYYNLMILTFDVTKATQATPFLEAAGSSSRVHTAPLGLTQTR